MFSRLTSAFCRFWLALLLGACLSGGLAHAAGGKVALVIGNGAYRHAPLKNPGADAHAMAEQLRRLGFEVIERRDTTREQMAFAIRDFGDRLRGASVGVFYYAGHGVQVRGRNYLIPVDTVAEREDEVPYRSIDANEVLDKIDTARAPVNVVILDACRNNPFARSGRGGAAPGGLASMDAPTGSLIAFSTAPGAVAEDGSGVNGTYTKYLLKHIATPGLQVENMFKRVRVDVARETSERQIPWESSSLKTDFSFGGGAAGAAQSVAASDDTLVELAFWDSVKNSSSAADYRAYLEQYPQGRFAPLARARAATLAATAGASAPSPAANPVTSTPAPATAPIVPMAALPRTEPIVAPARTAPGPVVASPRLVAVLPDGAGWVAAMPGGAMDVLYPDGRLRRRLAADWLAAGDELLRLRPSPDGQWLALLARQGGGAVLRIQPLQGGAAAPVTQAVGAGAVDVEWSFSARDLLLMDARGVGLLALDRKTGTPGPSEVLVAMGEWNAQGMRLSPDGRWLALWGRTPQGSEVRVLDLAARTELWRTAATAMDFSPRVGAALVAGVDGKARLVESGTGRILRQLDSPGQLLEGRYSAGGEWLTTLESTGHLTLWDTQSAQPLNRVALPEVAAERALAINDDASAALSNATDGWRVMPLKGAK